MNLVITYGSFNPPTKADAMLFDFLATMHRSDTEVVILTDTRFDTSHPMGVLEKQQVLNVIRSKNIQVRLDYDHLLQFLEAEAKNYDKILILHDSTWPKSAVAACKSITPNVEFQLFDGTEPDKEKFELLAALHSGDFDHFSKYYGGPAHDAVHLFNNLKDRVIWKNAETD